MTVLYTGESDSHLRLFNPAATTPRFREETARYGTMFLRIPCYTRRRRAFTVDFTQGEEIVVPCKHCASVSIRVEISRTTKELRCPKCGETTRIRMEPQGGELRIHSEAM